MSDLCLYELEDNVWDEFGESDDHIVPHPGNKLGDKLAIEGDNRKKQQSDVSGFASDSDTSTKHCIPGKEKRNVQLVINSTEMLDKGPWSHTPDCVFPSRDTNSTQGVTGLTSNNPRISGHSFKSGNVESGNSPFCADDPMMGDDCTADENNLYRYPLDQMPQSGNDLSFFDNDQEDKDTGDLLYYGWPDIGNFEDVDRMFRSCDSTFGIESLNNDEEMCWFSSNAPEGSEDTLKSGLKVSGQNAGPSNGFSEQYEGSESEGREISVPKELINFSKKPSKHQNQLGGEGGDQYLEQGDSIPHYDNLKQITDIKHPSEDLSCKVYSTSAIQNKRSTGPDPTNYVQRRYMHLDFSHQLDQISVCPTPSGKKSDKNSCTSSLKESTYASNQLHSMESNHGLLSENPTLVTSGKSENMQSCQGFQPSLTKNIKNATTQSSLVFCGTLPNQKQSEPSESRNEGQTDVKDGCIKLQHELDSSNVQESTCMSTVLDDFSLEATSFRQLQQVMEKLDVRTKLCIRDSLYRLARSAEQRHNYSNQRVTRDDNGDAIGALSVEDTSKCTGFLDMETGTNPIDRSIAHLLFHRPSDPSRVPSTESLSLRSNAPIHESVSSPQAAAEKRVFQEEALAGGKKETLITDEG